MKKLFILPMTVTILYCGTLLAKTKSNPTNLMHITPMASFLSETNISYHKNNSKNKLGSSSNLSENTNSFMVADESFSFGVSSGLEVGAKVGILLSGEKKVTPVTGAETTTNFSGVTDFDIFSKYRIISDKKGFSNIDILASLSPGLTNNKYATANADGNAQRGGHKLNVGMRMGKDNNKEMSYSLGIDVEYLTSTTIEDPTSKAEFAEETSKLNIKLNSKVKIPLASHSLDFGLKILLDGAYDYTVISNQSKVAYGASTNFNISSGFNFRITPSFYVTPSIEYSLKGDRDAVSTVVDSIDIERSSMEAGVNVKFLF